MTRELLDQHGNPVRSKYLRSAPREDWAPCTPNQLRMCVLGMPNSGKTEFCCSIPNALILDLAGHANMVPRPNRSSHIERVTDVVTVMNIIDELVEQKKRKPWQTVVLDDGDIFMEWMIRWLSKHPKYNIGLRQPNGILDDLWSITDYGQGGKGWYIVRDEILERTVDRLTDAGYGWVVTGNFSQKQRAAGDRVERYQKPVMAASVLAGIHRAAHYMLHFAMSHEVEKITTGERQHKIGGAVRSSPIVEYRPVHRLFAVIQPPDEADEAESTKARFIEHMPQDENGLVGFEVKRDDPWGSWVKVYLDAVTKTAAEMGVTLDAKFAAAAAAKSDPPNGLTPTTRRAAGVKPVPPASLAAKSRGAS